MSDTTQQQTSISPTRLASKVVIVTGAAKGIGQAVAMRCGQEGAKVVLVDRDEDALKHAEKTLTSRLASNQSAECALVVGDIAEESTVRNMIDKALDQYGRLDGLVNNAGVFGTYNRFENNSIETFDQMVSINVRPAWLAMKYAKIAMLENDGGGSIVNIASMAAMRANRGLSLYGMTKGAIANLTFNAATEFAKHNIRVNAICPGPIDTDMLGAVEEFIDERNSDVARSRINQTIPLGRYGRPEEIASVAAFLLSHDASFVTGIRMPVDGGQSLE